MTVEEQDAKPVVAEEPSFTLKAVDSEVDMEDEQTQAVGSAESESALDSGIKKKPLLASRLLKSMKSTMGIKGKG